MLKFGIMVKDKIEILLEEIRNDVKLALEGHDIIRREMHEKFSELKLEVDMVKGAVEYVAKKVNMIEKKLDDHIRQPAHV
ncbi:MAG: hypothetical protein QME05_01480 [Candidatus Margulisbacteria bacterium]|nr:hypothetical protein [Candidatus Margulisiibacteriota bacterium]